MIILVFTNIPPIAFVAAALDILVSMAVHAASEWQGWLINFLSVIGYRSGCCDAVVIEDFVLFRQMKYTRLNQESWNMRHRLPTGLAATGAAFVSWAVVSPGIDAEWYAGPGLVYYAIRVFESKLRREPEVSLVAGLATVCRSSGWSG